MPFDLGHSDVLRSDTTCDVGRRRKLSKTIDLLTANNNLLDPKSRNGVIDVICRSLYGSNDNELRHRVEVLIETFIDLGDADAASRLIRVVWQTCGFSSFKKQHDLMDFLATRKKSSREADSETMP